MFEPRSSQDSFTGLPEETRGEVLEGPHWRVSSDCTNATPPGPCGTIATPHWSMSKPPTTCSGGMGSAGSMPAPGAITVSGGMYPGEVGWVLSCADGTTLSGGNPFTGLAYVTFGTLCTLTATDSWGDGWNGASWMGLGATYTLASGSGATYTFTAGGFASPPPSASPSPPFVAPPIGAPISSTITMSGGSYPGEVGFTISCANGLVVSGGNPFSGSVTVPLNIFCTLTATDSWGDGWNGASWMGLGTTYTMPSGSGPFTYTFFFTGGFSSPPPPAR